MILARIRARPAPLLLFLAGLVAAYVSITAYYHLGVAHADPAAVTAPASDPVVVATGATDASWDLVAQYGPLWGGALLAFGVVGALLRSNQSKHWIAQGRVLALLTGAAMIIGAVLDWHFHGAPIAGVLVTAIMAIKLVWSPAVATPLTGPVLDAAKAPVAMLLVLLLGLGAGGATLSACHLDTVKADAGALAHGAVICAKADVPAIDALGIQLTTEALVSALGGHSVPWTQLETEAEAAAKAQGIAVGSCAFGQLIADLSKLLPPPAPGVMARTDDGSAELATLKAHLGVTTIQTASGQVL